MQEAATVLQEIHGVPDKDIPQDLWDQAACVMVVPGLKKAAFVVGGEYGKGLMSCRHDGEWTAPIFMQVGKGSWGLQIGAQSIDLVLLVMNEQGHGEDAAQQGVARRGSLGRRRPGRPRCARRDRRADDRRRSSRTRARRDCLPESTCRAAWCGPMSTTTSICTARRSRRKTS